jgi:group I intron endonuclease
MKNTYYKSGVYALIAVESNKIYIGSTKCFKTRKNNHMSSLKRGDIKKCVSNFLELYRTGELIEFQILEVCDNYVDREQYWIDFYKRHPTLELVNIFDAKRENSFIPDSFRDKMTNVLKDRWKNDNYRNNTINRLMKTAYKKGDISKRCKITFAELLDGTILEFSSAKLAADHFNFPSKDVVTYINRKKAYKTVLFYYK